MEPDRSMMLQGKRLRFGRDVFWECSANPKHLNFLHQSPMRSNDVDVIGMTGTEPGGPQYSEIKAVRSLV